MAYISDHQYATDENLRARQRLWETSPRHPPFHLFSWVTGLARLTGNERVLDLGCGNGSYLELISGVGIDASLGMLGTARTRTEGPLVNGDAMALPFRDAAFDVVLAAHMLYHVPDRELAAGEMRRVLSPGGVCVAVTNGETNKRAFVQLVEDVVGHGWRWREPGDAAFSLENGGPQLASAFEHVTRVDCPTTTIEVTDVDAFAAYLSSVRDHHEPAVKQWTTWPEVVEESARRAAAVIAAEGALRFTTSIGAFICH